MDLVRTYGTIATQNFGKKMKFKNIKISDEDLTSMVKRGVGRNTLVYDPSRLYDGNPNITKKLVYTMWSFSEDMLKTLIIPTDKFPEFDFERELYQVSFIRDRRLDLDGIVLQAFKDAGGSFPGKNTSLVIGVEKGGKILLGSV